MSGNCGCQRKKNMNPNPNNNFNNDINLNPSPNQFKYNLLQQIQQEYSGFKTVETYSDIDIKELNDGRNKYQLLSSLMFGVNLDIIGITDDVKQTVIDPSLYTYDKRLGNIQLFTNELEYTTFTVLGFKGLKERKFLFKNIITNITNKPLPNSFLFQNFLDFDVN
jgi:hypothetical protein